MRILKLATPWAIAALMGAATAGAPLASMPSAVGQPIGVQNQPPGQQPTRFGSAGARVPLLLLSRGRFSAHLLPESHVGYPGEFETGFREQVLPAARRARTLIYEGALLDPWSDWVHWRHSCLDDRPELAGFNAQMTSRIVSHHRHSYWNSLRLALPNTPDASAEEQFTAFIASRSLLVNYFEVELRIRPFLERELAVLHSTDRQLTVQEYFAEFSARTRITRRSPHLARESIETLEDFAWATCTLDPLLAKQMLDDALKEVDALERIVPGRQPGAAFEAISAAFSTLQVQLGLTSLDSVSTLTPLFGREGRISSESVLRLLPYVGSGPARDMLFLGLRNQRWAERIDEHARAGRKGLFYVFGAMHLLDYEHFDGLLTLLEQRGFTIQVVRPDGRLEPLNQRLSSKSRPTAPSSSLQWTGTHR